MRNRVLVFLEVVGVAEHEPYRVPDPPVSFRDPAQYLLGDRDVTRVIRRSRSQSQYVRARPTVNLAWVDRIAERLGHLPSLPVHLSLIHISEPTRLGMISYAVFCL